MKIGPKRSSGKGDNNPPIYKEDVERAGEEQTKEYVAMALDHYNATTEGPKYELVEAIGVNGIVHIGLWYHVCFIAKPVSVATDASPKHFFAEIAYHLGNAISCRIMDLNSPDIQLTGVENVPSMLRCTTLEVDFKSVTGPIANLYPFTRAVMMRLYLWSGG
ncbi:hypothetical protein OROMI_032685 [Orobanche minor]